MKRKTNDRKWGAAVLLLLLVLFLNARKANTYRKVIYLYESDPVANRAQIERYIGRPHYDIYRLPVRPRYKHFWDEYNGIDPSQLAN